MLRNILHETVDNTVVVVARVVVTVIVIDIVVAASADIVDTASRIPKSKAEI